MSTRRGEALCRVLTLRGGPCIKYLETCPHHRRGIAAQRRNAPAAAAPPLDAALDATRLRPPPGPDDGSLLAAARAEAAHAAAAAHSWPGVRAGPGGRLCDDPAAFAELLQLTHRRYSSLPAIDLVRDYHMCRTLGQFFIHCPPGTPIKDQFIHKGRLMRSERGYGTVAFAGGTSLTAAHRIGQRVSEDIDLLIVSDRSPGARTKKVLNESVARTVAAVCAPGVASTDHEIDQSRSYVVEARVGLAGEASFLKAEASTISRVDDNLIGRLAALHPGFEPSPMTACQTMMGWHAPAETLDQYPELAPFEVPALAVPFTACNKFFAIHTRASRQAASAEEENYRLTGLEMRGRDVYDLWAISESADHAAETRATIAEIAAHVTQHGVRKERHSRPAGGFAASAAFQLGTAEYEALRSGYGRAVAALVWGHKPAFADAVAAAQRLDPG